MTGTPRWLDSRNASKDVLDLLEHAQTPRALDAATRERSRRRLLALSAVPAAAGVFWLQSVALGALLGAAVGGAILAPAWLRSTPEETARAQPSQARSPVHERPSPRAPELVPSAAFEHTPELVPSAAFESAPLPRANSVAPMPGSAAPTSGPVASDLAREARLLESARGMLAKDSTAALRLLQQHEREFGAGALVLEREFLRVDALVRLGRTREAQRRAKALESLAPGHLYEQRLKSLLGPDE